MHTPIQLKTAHFQSEKTEILFQKSIGEKCRLRLAWTRLKTKWAGGYSTTEQDIDLG
jgi:hypothetical protein